MKSTIASIIIFFLVVHGHSGLLAQRPIIDFQPDQELCIVFKSSTSSEAPFLQYVDYKWTDRPFPLPDGFDYWFSPLIEDMAVTSHDFFDAAAIKLGGIPSVIIATTRPDNAANFYRLDYDKNSNDVTCTALDGLNDFLVGHSDPQISSGFFSRTARELNREQLFIETCKNEEKYWTGFWFNNEVEEWGNLMPSDYWSFCYPKWSHRDLATGDLDGDGVDEMIAIYKGYHIGLFRWDSFPGELEIIKILESGGKDYRLIDISSGDIDRDGRDEIVIFGYFEGHRFMGRIYDFDLDLQRLERVSYAGNDNAMNGLLLDSDDWWINHNGGGSYKLDVEMQDIDFNGYCDIAFALSGKKDGVNTLFNWVYTFDADGIEFPKERVSTTVEDAGLDVSMTIANLKGVDNTKICSITNKPSLYVINFDREKDEFTSEPPLTAGLNDIRGFDRPIIVAADIDNDSEYVTNVEKERQGGVLPTEFSLSQNYPNPFNPKTQISFEVPNQSNVRIEVFNMLGQRIKSLYEELTEPGYYEVIWDGTNNSGVYVSSGIFLCKMEAEGFKKTQKMVLLK